MPYGYAKCRIHEPDKQKRARSASMCWSNNHDQLDEPHSCKPVQGYFSLGGPAYPGLYEFHGDTLVMVGDFGRSLVVKAFNIQYTEAA
jgi:hypothetical protein